MQVTVARGRAGRAPGWELLVQRAQAAGLAAAAVIEAPPRLSGSAWVVVQPGTSAFARWLVRTGRGIALNRTVNGGVRVEVPARLEAQALGAKQAYLQAYAVALGQAGVLAEVHALARSPF